MSLRNRFVLPVLALLSIAMLVGCGSSGSSRSTPPPSGAFTNSDLSGTYVFSIAGQDATGGGGFIAIAGTFTADGSGNITGGTITANDPFEGLLSGQPVTNGTYNVGVDGRPASGNGQLVLNTSVVPFVFDFVLTSSSHGLITLYDPNNGTGSGTFDLQASVTQSNIESQTYAFNFSGVQFITASGIQNSFATAGAFALDANGAIGVSTTGFQDFNENGLAVCSASTGCQITAGSVNLASIPGIASLTSSAGTYSFDVYPVDSTHLKFVETDPAVIMAGDAFSQSASMPTGNNVFSLAGFDSLAQGPFTAAGIFDLDGSGNVASDSIEDINDVGLVSEVGSVVSGSATITGNYTALTNGRSVITLSGFANGTNGGTCSACQFAAYPSSGGLQLIEIDDGGSTVGVAYTQTATALPSAATGYGMNITGNNGVEEDDIAEFTNNNGAFSAGHIDFNDDGSTNFDLNFSSTYSADSTVAGRGTVAPGTNGLNLTGYVVDNATVVLVETDTNPIQVGLGSMVSQGGTVKTNAAAQHLAALRVKGGVKNSLKRR